MSSTGHRPYGDAMTEYRGDSLQRHPWVTIEAAAELTSVDIHTLREWARLGDLVIEERGDMEVVALEVVTALASRYRASKRGTLGDRLREAEDSEPTVEVVNIADLQELARERAD
jgi:phage terminase Nu1 subunit (DNA packaging protein)